MTETSQFKPGEVLSSWHGELKKKNAWKNSLVNQQVRKVPL